MKKTLSIILSLSMLAASCNFTFTAAAVDKATTTVSYHYGESNAVYRREMETLDRGLIAVKNDNGVYLSWRLLGDEATISTVKSSPCFNVYRNGTLIDNVKNSTNYVDELGTVSDTYYVSADSGIHQDEKSNTVTPLDNNYIDIPMVVPEDFSYTDNAGETVKYSYSVGDISVGDLDGDNEYELVVKWNANPKDNSNSGVTGNVYLDAYELDGTQLWRIDLGRNIRSGEHYTQFLVYDFDLDGHAEITCKTAPGSIDGTGNYVTEVSNIDAIRSTDNSAEYMNSGGYILEGPEYFTIFDGTDGAALDTIYYPVQRIAANTNIWGDAYGNRLDRYVADVAYLDGVRPYAVYVRGYYDHRNSIAAITFDGENLNCEDCFDTYDVDTYSSKSSSPSYNSDTGEYLGVKGYISGKNYNMYIGQGNHNMTVADVDGDGRDEIITGSVCFEKTAPGDIKGNLVNGGISYEIESAGVEIFEPKWCTGLGHGDAMHIGDYDPTHDGFEFFSVHEGSPYGMSVIDAATGEILYHENGSKDTGRGVMANTGAGGYYQFWAASGLGNMRQALGDEAFETSNIGGASINFRIFWDGDLYEELLDGTGITSYNTTSGKFNSIFNADGCISINSTKSSPSLTADIFGDWREEVAYPLSDNSTLRVYTTTIKTEYKLPTLMHDPVYRSGVSAEQSAYNQPPHVGFYLSEDLFANEIVDLEITNLPEKTTYSVGETFEKTGMVVTALYNNDEYPSKIISDYTISGFNSMSAESNQTITVSYRGLSETFTVEIKTDFTVDAKGNITGYAGVDNSAIIPKYINGIAVTGIADNALSDTSLETVYVYDHITDIGLNAFGSNITIKCYEGSNAHIYAAENNINYKTIERINKDYSLNITFEENEYLNFPNLIMTNTGQTHPINNLTYIVPGRQRSSDYFSGFSLLNADDNKYLKACVSRFAAERSQYSPYIVISDVPTLSSDYDYVFETDIYFNDDTTVENSPAKSKMDIYDSTGVIDSVHCEALGLETNVWYTYRLIQHESKYIRVINLKDGGIISISALNSTPAETGVNRLQFGAASGSFVTKINGKNTALGNSYILLDNMKTYSSDLAVTDAVITIKNSRTGSPVEGAIISSDTIEYVSDKDGRVNISNIPCGTYKFKVIAEGYASDTITLVAYEKSISRDVILSVPLKGLSFEDSTISIRTGDTYVLSPVITPANSTDIDFEWFSSNESVVSVKNGQIAALKPGESTITVTSSAMPEINAKCIVKVCDAGYEPIPTTIKIKCNENSGIIPAFGKNTVVQFTATVYDQNGVIIDKNVTFSTNNSPVTISSDGHLTIPSNANPGTLTVTAKCDNATAIATLPLVKMIVETTIFANPNFHEHSGLNMRMSAEEQTYIVDDDITLGVGARSSPDNTTGFAYTNGYLTGYVGEYANAGNRHAYLSFTNASLPDIYENNIDYVLQFDFNFIKPTVEGYTHILAFADNSNNAILSIAEENYSMLKVDTWYTAQIIYNNSNYVVAIYDTNGMLVSTNNMTSTNNTAIKRINFFGTGGRNQSNSTAIDNLRYYSSEYDIIKLDSIHSTVTVAVNNDTQKTLYFASYNDDNTLKSATAYHSINGFNIDVSDMEFDKIFLWNASTQKPIDILIK